MRFGTLILFMIALIVSGCQASPATVVYIVLSPTPDPNSTAVPVPASSTLDATALSQQVEATVAARVATTIAEAQRLTPTVEAQVAAAPTIAPTVPSTVSPTETMPATLSPSPAATEVIASATPTATPEGPQPTPLPTGFPTPVLAQVQVAEQLFERGRMFWVQPTEQIWVLIVDAEGRGTWSIYEDTYVDGEPETDPSLVPPNGLYQPTRGFGKLWRELDEVRDELGWAVTPEFGYVSRYEYHHGGSVRADGTYEPGNGYHILYSLYGEQFRFNESDSTWQLGGG